MGIVLAASWPNSKRCEAYFIMLYLRGAFYLITVIFNYLVSKLHSKLRLDGYHDFHREMQNHHTIPMAIVNLWNSTILAVSAGLAHFYGVNFFEKCIESYLSPIIYIVAFQVTETIIFFFVHGFYISKVVHFNNMRLAPDAMRGSISTSTGSVGLVHSQSEVNDLLEKQSDLIDYLRDHVTRLNQKLQQLSNQLRTVTLSTPHPAI